MATGVGPPCLLSLAMRQHSDLSISSYLFDLALAYVGMRWPVTPFYFAIGARQAIQARNVSERFCSNPVVARNIERLPHAQGDITAVLPC